MLFGNILHWPSMKNVEKVFFQDDENFQIGGPFFKMLYFRQKIEI
jgi:hypothetical protein